ncbi:hypothetical protein QR680_004112 [Steinernema hermaphroditum]|uniref:Uncharacterized protein n=1 Tax=Steinernema hermaphroditum TaxID=289476 RepID=A0AA39HNR1_9BILA|nr:hypothetical protein QR680_004112 [Steinernema hermaphroditum]
MAASDTVVNWRVPVRAPVITYQPERRMEESRTCHGKLPIKAGAMIIAIINIFVGICGIPTVWFVNNASYGYAPFITMIVTGTILFIGIYLEKPCVLSYFRTYQWFVNLMCILTLLALFFLQFNITTFIDKYWPDLHQHRPVGQRYTAEEYHRGHVVLTAYTVALIAYIVFGIISMYMLKKCMKHFQHIHKDGANYPTCI